VALNSSQDVVVFDDVHQALLPNGELLSGIHAPDSCFGEYCVIHKPSNHGLRNARMAWVSGVGLVRYCTHGKRHPDPDTPQAVGHSRECPCCCFVLAEMI